MKRLILILLFPVVGSVFGQVEDVRITADGTVINTKTVKFATGKLMVNGVAVVGGGASGVTSVSGTAPIVSSGGTTPAISITAATTGAAGSMSAADKLKLDGIAAGAQPGTVTSVAVSGANGIGITGSPITTSGTISLSLGAITPTSVAASGAVSGSNLSGTNTGDQTSIVGITGTTAQFNTALTGADFATGGGTATGTNTGDQNLSGLQPLDDDLTALASLTTEPAGLGLLEFVTVNDIRAYIGAGTGSGTVTNFFAGDLSPIFTTSEATTTTTPALTFSLSTAAANTFFGNGTGSTAAPTFMSASTARTALALVPGTDVQVFDADLLTIAGLTATTDNFLVSVASAWASRTPAQVRTTLGLVIGTNVQAWDADLDTWATKTPFAGTLTITTGKTVNITNTLTFSGTDSSTLNIGAGGTLGSAAFTASGDYATAAHTHTGSTLSGIDISDDTNLAGTANEITLTGDTISLPSALTFTGKTITGGSYVAPALGTPASGVMTNVTGTASGLTAGTATNLAGGSGGTIPYQSAAGTTAMLANGTVGQVLQSNGTTLAPTWVAPSAGYLVYTALLTQTSTNAPVATVSQNTLGGTVVWTYSGLGSYLATLSGAFTANKTWILIGQLDQVNGTAVYTAYAQRDNNNEVTLRSYAATIPVTALDNVLTDGILAAVPFEIRVYP